MSDKHKIEGKDGLEGFIKIVDGEGFTWWIKPNPLFDRPSPPNKVSYRAAIIENGTIRYLDETDKTESK